MRAFVQTTLVALVTFGLAGIPHLVSAQNKALEKTDLNIESGQYEKAGASLRKMKEKLQEKGDTVSAEYAAILIREAENNTGLGMLSQVPETVEASVAIIESLPQVSPEDKLAHFTKASEAMILYGNYRLAEKYLDQAAAITTDNQDQLAELDVLKARIYTGKGYYRKAVRLIDNKLPYYKERLQSVSDKKETRQAGRDYAYMLLMRANSLRLMGNYNSADSAFTHTISWIKDNLGKADLLYSWSQYLNARLLEENGLNADALVKFYQDAYANSLRKNSPAHYINILIQEKIIKAFYRNENIARYKAARQLFEETLRKNFAKESANRLLAETLEYDLNTDTKNVSNLENQVNELLSVTTQLPENHQRRIDLLFFANRVALLNNSFKNTETYLQQILRQQKHLYGEDAPVYHLTRIKLANYYAAYTDKFDEAAEIYRTSFEDLVSREITSGHVDYPEILSSLAVFYEESDNYKAAASTLEEALALARRKYDDRDLDYALELEKIANLQIKIGAYKEAEKNIRETLDILGELRTELATAYYARALITEAKLLLVKGEYDQAEANLFKSEKIKSKLDLPPALNTADNREDQAELFSYLGRFGQAEELLAKAITEKENRFGKDSRYLLRPLALMARVKLLTGQYAEAEKLAGRAKAQALEIFGTQSTKLTPSMTVLADVYTAIGDYDKAQQTLQELINIQQSRFGPQHVDLGALYGKLALVRFYNGDQSRQTREYFIRAENIIGKKLGGSNPAYAEMLKNLAVFNIAERNYTAANSYLDDASAIWSQKIGRRNNVNAATVKLLKGDIAYKQENYNQAIDLYRGAERIYLKIFNLEHPEYIKTLSKLSRAYFMNGDLKNARDLLDEVLQNYAGFIDNYFPTLSEREKAKFWNTIKQDYEFYFTLVLSDPGRRDERIGDLYNSALLSKALLLNDSRKIRQNILNSGDQDLIDVYKRWIDKKERLTEALSLSSEQLAQNGINTTTLSGEIEFLEKKLSGTSASFRNRGSQQKTSWKDIKDYLQEDEVAIEMARFRYFNKDFTDSVVYAMFVLTPDKKSSPEIALIRNGRDLENRYLKYYRTALKFNVKDNYSYENYWKPVKEASKNAATILLSPDGVFNQINLEAIPVRGDSLFVLDQSDIVLLNNTREIYNRRSAPPSTDIRRVAAIFGDPEYYVTTSRGNPVSGSGLTRSSVEQVADLPGTRKEVERLEALLNNRGWKTDEYVDEAASEEQLKKVDNPGLIHIATHGFFKENSGSDEVPESYLYDNPLLNSGLLLTGAGDILNQTRFNYNLDNGILTAYEAMNMNLEQTELVVLSACETGLGKLEAGEGVYGLQRAFLVAGARNIIMSLATVDDAATNDLMVNFYRKWMETGDKRASFIYAKKEVREIYKKRNTWGLFIMVGLN